MNKIFFIACVGFLFFNSCKSEKKNDTATKDNKIISDSTMHLLKFDTAKITNIDNEVKLTGSVSFNDNKVVKVFSFSSGQVINVNVGIGDYVKQGQTLATIRSADVAGNYADLSAAGNDIAIAKRSMDNATHLYKNGIASEKEYIEAKENYNKALSNAGKIRSQIQINGGRNSSENGTYVVSSPRSGFVVERHINPGNFIRNDNNNEMFTIGDISDVWIWANVFETDISKVKKGYDAEITTVAYPDRVFMGKVDKLSEFLDPATKVMKVKIVLPNPGNYLKPEMFANIVVRNKEGRQLVAVPTSAIISENGKNYVVIFNNQKDVTVQQIEVFKTNGDKTFLLSGVSDGQKVITQNQILVYRKLTDK